MNIHDLSIITRRVKPSSFLTGGGKNVSVPTSVETKTGQACGIHQTNHHNPGMQREIKDKFDKRTFFPRKQILQFLFFSSLLFIDQKKTRLRENNKLFGWFRSVVQNIRKKNCDIIIFGNKSNLHTFMYPFPQCLVSLKLPSSHELNDFT